MSFRLHVYMERSRVSLNVKSFHSICKQYQFDTRPDPTVFNLHVRGRPQFWLHYYMEAALRTIIVFLCLV